MKIFLSENFCLIFFYEYNFISKGGGAKDGMVCRYFRGITLVLLTILLHDQTLMKNIIAVMFCKHPCIKLVAAI